MRTLPPSCTLTRAPTFILLRKILKRGRAGASPRGFFRHFRETSGFMITPIGIPNGELGSEGASLPSSSARATLIDLRG